MSQLTEYTKRVEQFVYRINEVSQMNFDDQHLLLQSSIHSVMIFCFCLQSSRYRLLTVDYQSNWNYLNLNASPLFIQQIQQIFPSFFQIHQLTYAFEKELALIELDDKEIALMICVLIVSIG